MNWFRTGLATGWNYGEDFFLRTYLPGYGGMQNGFLQINQLIVASFKALVNSKMSILGAANCTFMCRIREFD